MIVKIEFPDSLPEGHGSSFKKGVAEILLENAGTSIGHTPNGHEKSRTLGRQIGNRLVEEITKVVKPIS
jgi:hypothetical protein